MAREKTKDLISQMIPKTDTQKTTRSSTGNTQATHKDSTINTLKRYDVRFNPDDWEWLKQHFQAKGLTVSAGLRMIVKEYLSKERQM